MLGGATRTSIIMKWLQSKRRLLLRQSDSSIQPMLKRPQGSLLGDQHKFDEASGQVYTELTASILSEDDHEWTRQTRIVVKPEYRDFDDPGGFLDNSDENEANLGAYHEYLDGLKNTRVRGLNGARSLQDIAVDCILNNISDCTLEGISCLPISLVRRIWHAVNRRCTFSLDTWMIFSKILHDCEGSTLGLWRYRQVIQQPLSQLLVYTNPLTSSSYDFITSLSITTFFSLPDLVKLSQITNLGALEIINNSGPKALTPIPVSDRLIRAWHFAALNEGSFSVLRILKLWNHEDVTSKSLAYLNSFPILALFDVRGCAFDLSSKIEAKRFGWKATVETNVLGLLEAACVERAMMMQESLGIEIKSVRKASARQLWDGSKTRKIPRSRVASFLTRPQALVPGRPLIEEEAYACMHKRLDKMKKQDKRWNLMDSQIFSNSRALESWDFATYTSFVKLGELRNDTDLARAGVDIGDHAILVDNEIVNSVPMVSLRLGDTPIGMKTSVVNSAHKPFYNSLYEDSGVSSLKYDRSENNGGSYRTLSFIRIKISAAQKPPEAPPRRPEDTKVHFGTTPPAATLQEAPSKRRKVGVMKSRKKNIGDVLNSFR
ncbi:hypothetical protein BJ875DRAFT_472267 [Amylocarpus encephaloides]|uniref:Uncharacterized protein n=1 Tax=Amylocarpus encephaloides TaxID=45428 RepID=A0A9P7YB39_9HELO|nr:hypothetical protein BJ875DRAFT_472267 [Amylocarpus encephaloides]